MREKTSSSGQFADEKAAALAQARREHQHRIKTIERTHAAREKKFRAAIRHFKPRKSERGKIVFIGAKGGRIGGDKNRRGFAVYVDQSGKKRVIRQRNKISGKLEKTPTPRRLVSIDVSRVRSKKAKRQFYFSRTNPVARRELQKTGKKLSRGGTRYSGEINTKSFYAKSDSITILAKELCAACNGQRGKRDFLVTLGFHVTEGNGKKHWIELSRRFSRKDGQLAEIRDVRRFFYLEVYAFLAKELSYRGLVLSGSARHIARLEENKGNPRDKWTKDGYLWEGHDQKNVTIDMMEYRIDHLTFDKKNE